LSINDSQFAVCQAKEGEGGCLYVERVGTVNFDGCTFSGSRAGDVGGALSVRRGTAGGKNPTMAVMAKCTLSGNWAANGGGAVCEAGNGKEGEGEDEEDQGAGRQGTSCIHAQMCAVCARLLGHRLCSTWTLSTSTLRHSLTMP